MRPARILIPVALVALLFVLPALASAQGAGEPEMMEDPIDAMEPEVQVADPVEPVAPVADAEVAAQGNALPQAQGVAAGAVADDAGSVDSTGALAPSTPVASGSGQLPFTGLDSGRLMELFLVGSVLLAGGVTALAWAGARTETA